MKKLVLIRSAWSENGTSKRRKNACMVNRRKKRKRGGLVWSEMKRKRGEEGVEEGRMGGLLKERRRKERND